MKISREERPPVTQRQIMSLNVALRNVNLTQKNVFSAKSTFKFNARYSGSNFMEL